MKLFVNGIVFIQFICLWSCVSVTGTANPEGALYALSELNTRDKKSDAKGDTVLKLPEGYSAGSPEVLRFGDDFFDCSLFAKSFAQGNALYGEFVLKLRGSDVENAAFTLKGENVPLTETAWGYRCFAAIHPEQKPGKIDGVFKCTVNGKSRSVRVAVKVKDVEYPVSTRRLDLGKFSDESYYKDPAKRQFIKECAEIRARAFKSDTADSITNSLSHPRDFHKITGAYWHKRIYLSYAKKKNNKMVKSKSRVSYHRGVDLKGAVGSPVFAMADGLVVLSHLMFFEGNIVAIDHGNRVFTYYMHMDSRGVKPGDRVRAGEQIGTVGSTGSSTGPHLHVALSIRGVHVDPLSLLCLPVTR
jgi:murein DD-endopeptidase MepM/ murein hydrolase activator NlpD